MKKLVFLLLALLVSWAAKAQTSPPAPQTVEIPSGGLRLKAYLWRPKGPGPFPAVVFNHGRSNTTQQHTRKLTITEAAQVIGPVYVKHGYVFLFPFRRGEGLSADEAPFIGDILQREEEAKGIEARKHLQFVLLTTDHLDDAMAALTFMKNLPYVDSHRIAVSGHSFGGQLTLLAAARDSTVRAVVAFAPAANSWNGSSELRERLLASVRTLTAPVMLLQAENDYSLAPTQAMADELSRLSKPYVRKVYPPVGETSNDGHNFLFTDIPRWERDVLRFLDENVRR